MELSLEQYINRWLRKAHYEFDSSVKAWVGWIEGYPGIYAQEKTAEDVRAELISILEEFTLLDLQEGKRIRGLPMLSQAHRKYAEAHKS